LKKPIFLLIFFLINHLSLDSKLYTWQPELFAQEAIGTEALVYKLMQSHNITNKIDYVAVPWSVLINKNLLNNLPNIQVNHGYTVCQHIRYEKIIPILKKMGVKILFTPHVNKDYEGITVLPFPHLAVNGVEHKNIIKDIWASFVGAEYTHFTRAKIFELFANDPRFILKNRGNTWHFYLKDENLELYAREYQDILLRSRFALCPRGTGASTIRFWESLQAGAIPVLISDEMRLPDYFDWEKCIIRIAEKDISQIPTVLESISLEQETKMQAACLKAYAQFSEENFIGPILNYYQRNGK
jgi:hypothetical protein